MQQEFCWPGGTVRWLMKSKNELYISRFLTTPSIADQEARKRKRQLKDKVSEIVTYDIDSTRATQ